MQKAAVNECLLAWFANMAVQRATSSLCGHSQRHVECSLLKIKWNFPGTRWNATTVTVKSVEAPVSHSSTDELSSTIKKKTISQLY